MSHGNHWIDPGSVHVTLDGAHPSDWMDLMKLDGTEECGRITVTGPDRMGLISLNGVRLTIAQAEKLIDVLEAATTKVPYRR